MSTTIGIHIDQGKQKRFNLLLPENWNELSKRKFIAAAHFVFESKNHEFEIKAMLFCALTGLKYKHFINIFHLSHRNVEAYWEESPDVIAMVDQVQGFLEQVELSKSKLKRYKLWFGPSERLENMTLKQYKFADPHFTAAMEDGLDEELLDDFLSLLYRPFGLPFILKLQGIIKWFVKKWPRKVKLAMLLNYIGIRNALAHEFEDLFSGGSSKKFDPMWVQKLIYDLPGDKFGKVTEIEKLPVPEAFEFMEHNKEREAGK